MLKMTATEIDDLALNYVETLDCKNMLIYAAKHVQMEQAQQLVSLKLVHEARQHTQLNLPHSMQM